MGLTCRENESVPHKPDNVPRNASRWYASRCRRSRRNLPAGPDQDRQSRYPLGITYSKVIGVYEGHTESVEMVAFSSGPGYGRIQFNCDCFRLSLIATASLDHTVRVFDLSSHLLQCVCTHDVRHRVCADVSGWCGRCTFPLDPADSVLMVS